MFRVRCVFCRTKKTLENIPEYGKRSEIGVEGLPIVGVIDLVEEKKFLILQVGLLVRTAASARELPFALLLRTCKMRPHYRIFFVVEIGNDDKNGLDLRMEPLVA
jgi:hypothetical protein